LILQNDKIDNQSAISMTYIRVHSRMFRVY